MPVLQPPFTSTTLLYPNLAESYGGSSFDNRAVVLKKCKENKKLVYVQRMSSIMSQFLILNGNSLSGVTACPLQREGFVLAFVIDFQLNVSIVIHPSMFVTTGKDHLGKNNVPVLAIAGDQDLTRPPEAALKKSCVADRKRMGIGWRNAA
uniref:Uncharacterized protein n=1 Tax=Salix viminalis TaxID=40686 RepID=A0A6N2LC39_SALVM